MKFFYCFCLLFSFNIVCSSNFKNDVIEREFEPILITSKLGNVIEFPIAIPKLSKTLVNINIFRPNGDIFTIHNNFNTIRKNESKCTNGVLLEFSKIVSNEKIDYYDEIVSLGPLKERDHGNWLVSSEFQDINGSFVEFFRIVSVEIVEIVPTYPHQNYLKPGDTYKIRLQENITNLLSCEIQAPKSTFDRYYERDLSDPEFCTYIIPDVKPEDEGIWKIIAVGNMVFEGHSRLHVLN